MSDQTGLTMENAIVVDSVEEEYQWLYSQYPDFDMIIQEVIEQSGKSYDVITIMTDEGEKMIYFDITGFYEK